VVNPTKLWHGDVRAEAGAGIDRALGELYPCSCHPDFKGRRKPDPTCAHHAVIGEGETVAAELERAGFLRAPWESPRRPRRDNRGTQAPTGLGVTEG
jgi:hypothetical protein